MFEDYSIQRESFHADGVDLICFAVCGQGVKWDWEDQTSCLAPSLERIMRDHTALTYFIQFLEPLGALCYVHFWLSADNFRTAIKVAEAKGEAKALSTDKPDCCPEVKQTLSKLMLAHHDQTSSESSEASKTTDSLTLPNANGVCLGSGDFEKKEVKSKIQVAKTINECNRACGIVPQWSECAPMTHFQHLLRDAVKICDRYLKSTSTWPRPLPREMVESIVQAIRTNSNGRIFDSDVFLPAQTLVFDILREDYYGKFLESDAFCNYRIDVLTNKSLELKDAIYDDSAAFFLNEYLEKAGHLELVEFLMTAANITTQLHNDKLTAEEAQNDAIVVYDR